MDWLNEPRFMDFGKKLQKMLSWLSFSLAVISITTLLLEYGFYLDELQTEILHDAEILAAILYGAFPFLMFVADRKNKNRFNIISSMSFFFLLIAGNALVNIEFLAPLFNMLSITDAYGFTVFISKLYIIFNLIEMFTELNKKIGGYNVHPLRTLVASFLVLILIGSILLSLPAATTSGRISYIDALFTATSATCVTGLIVKDTGTDFTTFGQIVILVLIQIGGLGLMTFAAFFTMTFGKRLNLREKTAMQTILSYERPGQISRIIIYILLVTLLIETTGTILLYVSWSDIDDRLYTSIFHSISAFCNAGFSLFSNSLTNYATDTTVMLIITTLIIIGGLGFTVLYNITSFRTSSIKFVRRFTKFRDRDEPPSRFSVQTKLVLSMSAALILLGTILFFTLEYNNTLADFSFGGKILNSYFQSVTPRTAGFNTIDYSQTGDATQFFTIIFMFIGASPISCGGGIKTVTLAILLLSIWNTAKGRRKIQVFRRSLPVSMVSLALTVAIVSLLLVCTFTLLLSITDPKHQFLSLLFEVVSAYGTVGLSVLSLKETFELSVLGKMILTCAMFIGRLGPLAMVLALAGKYQTEPSEYPNENVTVG